VPPFFTAPAAAAGVAAGADVAATAADDAAAAVGALPVTLLAAAAGCVAAPAAFVAAGAAVFVAVVLLPPHAARSAPSALVAPAAATPRRNVRRLNPAWLDRPDAIGVLIAFPSRTHNAATDTMRCRTVCSPETEDPELSSIAPSIYREPHQYTSKQASMDGSPIAVAQECEELGRG
jgi:hypothetical protein